MTMKLWEGQLKEYIIFLPNICRLLPYGVEYKGCKRFLYWVVSFRVSLLFFVREVMFVFDRQCDS